MSQRIETRLNELKSLPEFEPPAALEASTLAAMANAGAGRDSARLGMAAMWLALAVTGVLIAAVALDTGESGDRVAQDAAGIPPGDPVDTAAADDVALVALLEEAAYLEQMLAVLPQREIMRVSTAGTIVGLEQQLALIDAAQSTGAGETVPLEDRMNLLRARVETMNALVNVRYAQSLAFYH